LTLVLDVLYVLVAKTGYYVKNVTYPHIINVTAVRCLIVLSLA